MFDFFVRTEEKIPWTDRENNLFQLAIGVDLLFMGTFLGRIISAGENKKSATSAFRRIIDIEKALKRQSQFLNRLSGQKEITKGDITVLLEQNHSLVDTVSSSRLDWNDIIGDVIINTDRILELENAKAFYQGDYEKIAQLSNQINEIKERLPYAIQTGINLRTLPPQTHISDNIIDTYRQLIKDEHVIRFDVQITKPLILVEGKLKNHPPLDFKFTYKDNMFLLCVFAEGIEIGIVDSSPFNLSNLNQNDFSYTVQFLLRMHLQSQSSNPNKIYDDRLIIISDYLADIKPPMIITIKVPVDWRRMEELIADMPV